MSLILEALRKADRERLRDQPPSLHDAPPPRSAAATPGRGHLGVPTLVVAGLLVVALLVFLRTPAPAERHAAAATAAPATVAQAGPAAPPAVAAPAPAPRRELARSASLPAIEDDQLQSLDDLLPATRPTTAAMPATASAGEARIIRPSYAPRDDGDAAITEQAAPPSVDVDANSVLAAAATLPRRDGAGATPRITTLQLDPPPSAAASPATAPRSVSADAGGLPAIKLGVHFWNADPARRFVRIDGVRHVEGDVLPQGATLREITPTGVTLDYRGRSYQVSP